jgi:hypothetical protein
MATGTGKDIWDKMQAIGSLLSGIAVPVILFVAAQKVEELQKAAAKEAMEREQLATERARERELAISEISVRVSQASVIPPLIDGLLSTDVQRRKLAISAVLIALPEDGPKLVREISTEAPDQEVRTYASSALQSRKDHLVGELYAEDADARKGAARALAEGWRNDPDLAKRIVDQADANKDDPNGVYNSVAVLAAMSPQALAQHKARVETFVRNAAAQGDKTAAQAERVKTKLAPPAPRE